ncbi:DIMBOA UDP-glucosyltransferase BX8-like [Lolium rigidum]|uniref:DIMBOA UDP-glucosyltransferase BX8-like n=1 Tax=Lolium rigidum TaxID=89674 RepID=UPI001F5C1628|nr:DIMBOA UDP-glucosyltransferase BX8-like [Lolium rigidum]
MASEGNTVSGGLRGRRVLVFPLPYQGHINPMFQLAGLLHARGLAVTVFHSHFNAPDPSRHPAFDFVPVPDGLPPYSPVSVKETVEHILTINSSCEAPFRERLAALLEAPGARDDVACLVADAHLLTLMNVARQQGVPTLALRTGSAACFRNIMANPMLCDKGYLPAQESQLDVPVKELPPYRVRDLMIIGRSRDEHDLACKLLSRAVEAVRTSSGFILNTFDALEPDELATTRQDLALPVFDIGPLHKISPAASSSLLLQDRACLEWLDVQAPASVLYISFGSLASMSAADLAETAWGIANSGQSFLWVLRSDLVRGVTEATLPDGFDAATRHRGMIVSWAPQEEVLAHAAVGGFWTHCGWNSTLEGVCGGVPMLCRPYFGDQMGNARYVEHVWRAGFVLDCDLERGKVEEAVRRLMKSKEGVEMRKRAQELRSRAAQATDGAGSSRLNIDKLVNHILSR